jgi:hypothetical protein
VIASASGSQLASMVYGAEHVLFIVGAQKIVPDLGAAMRRVREYCLPLEETRVSTYGIGSSVHKVLTLHSESEVDHIHILI